MNRKIPAAPERASGSERRAWPFGRSPGYGPQRRRNRRAPRTVPALGLVILLASVPAWSQVEIDRRIYIPSNETGVLAREGEPGILLSEEEYRRLLREAGVERPEPPEIPFRARLEGVAAAGSFERTETGPDECLRVSASYTARVLSATWGEIPLAFENATPISVRTDGRWFIGTGDADQRPHLFVYGQGRHTIEIEFLAGVRREAGERRVEFGIPTAAAGSLVVRLPGANDVRSSLPVRVSRAEGETLAEVALGGAGRIAFAWFPATDKGEEHVLPVFAQSHLAYGISEGLVRITGTVLFSTLVGDIPGRVLFLLPEGGAVRQLTGRGYVSAETAPGAAAPPGEASALLGWRVIDGEVVVDRSPGRADGLELNLEIEVPFSPGEESQLPLVRIPGVFRHYGELALVGDTSLQVHVGGVTGLEPIEIAAFFGEAIAAPGQHLAAYRFFAEPVGLALSALRVEPELEATIGSWTRFRRDTIFRQQYLELVQKKGESRWLTLILPAGEELVRILDAEDRELEATETARDDGTACTVEFPEALAAGSGRAFTIESRIDPPSYRDLDATGIQVVLRSMRVDGAARMTGTVAVGADPVLRLTDVARGDLEPAPRPGEHPDALQSFFFREEYALGIRVSPKPSRLNAAVLMDVLPKEGFLTIHGEATYFVEGAGRREFALAFPAGVGAHFFPEGDRIKERSLVSEEGRDVWRISTQDAIEGEFRISFSGDVPMPTVVTVPEVSVPDAHRERGSIQVEANTETEIEFQTSGLASLDILDLPPMKSYQPKHRLIGAYQYVVHPYTLELKVTRHEAEPVLRLMADRLELMTVVSPSGPARTRAVYLVRGIRVSFLDVTLPQGSSLWSVLVGNEPVKPMRGEGDSVRIPVGSSLDRQQAVAVELTYESPLPEFSSAGNVEFLAPRLPSGIPVGETLWRLYLPEDYVYSDFDSELRLTDMPAPEPFLASVAEVVGRVPFAFQYMKAREDTFARVSAPVEERHEWARAPSSAREERYMDEIQYGYDANGSLLGVSPDQVVVEHYEDAGAISNGDLIVPGRPAEAPPPGVATRPEGEQAGAVDDDALRMLRSLGYAAAGVEYRAGAYAGAAAGRAGGMERREAGILPFRVALTPRGVEYVFRGLFGGERVAVDYRRVTNWNAWNVLIVIAVALLFARCVREHKAVKRTIWAAFVLTALPYLIGTDWTACCNRLLLGVFLGLLLVFVLRVRRKWILRAATATAALLVALGLPAAADTIYIPYDPAHPEAATREERVYVPYDRFQELWARAKALREGATEEVAPVGYALEDARYTLAVCAESVAVTAEYRLFLPKTEWVTIPFPFTGAELYAAKVDGEPARFEKGKAGYLLYARERGTHSLEFELMARAGLQPARGALALGIPPTFASQVRVLLPRPDLTADILPYHGGKIVRILADRKEITAGVGRTERLEVRWYPEVTRERPIIPINAEVLIHHGILGRVENWSADVRLSFPNEKHSRFGFALDPSLTLTSVKVPHLRDWTVRDEGGTRTLDIDLSEEAADQVRIEILAERRVEGDDRSVPMMVVPAARATATRAAISAAPWLDVRVDRDGFRRIEHEVRLIPGLAHAGVYEAHQPDSALRYHVAERPQEIAWELHYLFQVESRRIQEMVMVNMDVKQRPLFDLAIGVPPGYRCVSVDGPSVKDWWEASAQGEGGSRIDVEFAEGILGPSSLIVGLIRTFPQEPDALAVRPITLYPKGDAVRSRIQGSVLVAAHVSVQPRPLEETGLRSTSLCEDDRVTAECKVGGGFKVGLPLEPKLAYWFEQPDFSASFVLERVEPRETIVWTTLAEAHETWIAYSTNIRWQLLQGSSRTFTFEAPAELGEIVVTGESVREVNWEDEGNLRHYTVFLDAEVFAGETFTLGYESPIERAANVPRLAFPRADRTAGYILTANASPYELSARPAGSLNTAQRSDVPFLPKDTGVLGYYKVFAGDWDLTLELIRTVAAQTLPAVIDWVELATLIRRDGSTLNVATIRMQNKTLQFLPIRLPEGSRLLSLAVAGRAGSANTATRDGSEVLLIPLIKTEPGDLAYEIGITYERPVDGPPGLHERLRFDDPEILDIPVTQTFWTFYVPEEYNLYRLGGNMDETTPTAGKVVRLSAKEEERQRLKSIATGKYDLQMKARALENLVVLQEEMAREQGGLDLAQVQREAEGNVRLRGQVRELLKETDRLNQSVAAKLRQDESGELRRQLTELSRQIEAQPPQPEPGLGELRVSDEGARKDWVRNDDSDFFEAEGRQVRVPVQVLDTDEDKAGLTQYGANVYVESGKVLAKKVPEAVDRGREPVTQYFNIAQSASRMKSISENIDVSNAQIMGDLGLKQAAEQEWFEQRVTGRFKGGPVSEEQPALPAQGPAVTEPAAPQVAEPLAFGEAGQPVVGAPQPPTIEGAYSIPIPFPPEGKIVTFKKLKSGAEVKFTVLDARVSARAKRIAVILALAVVLGGCIRLVGNLAFVRRCAERASL